MPPLAGSSTPKTTSPPLITPHGPLTKPLISETFSVSFNSQFNYIFFFVIFLNFYWFFIGYFVIYLVFNTNSNQTVILTYNETTFNSCTTDDASDNDTFQYNGGSTEFGQSMTIAVPLTITGPNYFFSDANDGIQCQRGMAFQISVNHGQGLPPSLNQPPPPPYVAPPGPGTAQSPPITIVGGSPSLFNGASSSLLNVRSLLPSLLLCLAAALV